MCSCRRCGQLISTEGHGMEHLSLLLFDNQPSSNLCRLQDHFVSSFLWLPSKVTKRWTPDMPLKLAAQSLFIHLYGSSCHKQDVIFLGLLCCTKVSRRKYPRAKLQVSQAYSAGPESAGLSWRPHTDVGCTNMRNVEAPHMWDVYFLGHIVNISKEIKFHTSQVSNHCW